MRTPTTAHLLAAAALRYSAGLLVDDDAGMAAAAELDAELVRYGSLWPECHDRLLATLDEGSVREQSDAAAALARELLALADAVDPASYA